MNQENLFSPIGDVVCDGILRDLPVPLSDAERLAIADAKAAAEAELAAIRTRAAEQRRRIASMTSELRERQQRRVVPCYERWVRGQIEVVRRDVDPRDPASVIDRRPATTEESQRLIALDEPVEAHGPREKRKRK